jgi:hypothetical protein
VAFLQSSSLFCIGNTKQSIKALKRTKKVIFQQYWSFISQRIKSLSPSGTTSTLDIAGPCCHVYKKVLAITKSGWDFCFCHFFCSKTIWLLIHYTNITLSLSKNVKEFHLSTASSRASTTYKIVLVVRKCVKVTHSDASGATQSDPKLLCSFLLKTRLKKSFQSLPASHILRS